jgi:4-hydroxy-tetrahydrodipicolinate synthase
VIAGVGYRLDRAIQLGRTSIDAGADGLMIHHPIHPYVSEAGLVAHYTGLAEALPDVPLTLYITGPQLSPDGVNALAQVKSIIGRSGEARGLRIQESTWTVSSSMSGSSGR